MTAAVVTAAPHQDSSGFGDVWLSVLILLAVLLLAYLGMWRGWRRRGGKHDLPPLQETPLIPPPALLEAEGRYFGTTVADEWLDRVVAHGLGTRSRCELRLGEDGLDVLRPGTSFRIPASALRGARHDQGIAGKVVPPHGVLVVTWQHGGTALDSGFRLDERDVMGAHNAWVKQISEIVKENAG